LIPVWQFGSAHLAGDRTVIHFGSDLNLRRMTSPFARFRSCGRACCFAFITARFFRGDLSPETGGRCADF